MKTPSLGLSFALLFFTATSPASAQYIYLDSNADGVHTAADQLHAVGPTVVDIWLDTGHNRDGSATVCAPAPATPMNMFSYEASLEANGGTVVFSSYTNRVAQMGPLYPPHAPDGTRFATGPFATPVGAVLAPGKYQLGTVTVNVLSGMPSIRFVPTINDFGSYTLFGSFCDGTDYLNSIVLGTDFFDADGLPYGTGGTPNRAPTLSPPANMTVSTGENAVQPITATDPDGQLLTFAKISGPGFLTVSTTDQGAGTAHGEIRLTPFASDTGTATGSVGVSDGTESDQATFSIEVAAAPNHLPFVFPTPRLTVVAGEVGNLPLNAGDPDGGTLHFAKAAGPAYVRVRELVTGSGGASAVLTASPTLCDAGTAIATVSVSDGVSQGQRQVEVSVVPPSAPPDSIVRHFSYGPPGLAIAVGSGDMNGDGNLDVVAADSERGTLSVLLGRGDGSLSPAVSYPIAAAIPVSLAIADLDRDGHLDVAVPSYGGASVSVLLGRGDGTFLPRAFYDTGSGPYGVAAADLNRDGILDLVTSNQNSGTVSVLVGMGDGTFAANRDVPAGLKPSALAVGDFNLDGRPDVVVANGGATVTLLTVLPGLGDGSFGDALQTPGSGFVLSMSSGDWNWDGATDIAVSDLRNSSVRVLHGHGDGTFGLPVTLATISYPYGTAAGDLNGDGNLDLVVGDLDHGRVVILFGDGQGGFASPAFLPTGATVGIALGDLNSDGRPDVIAADAAVAVALNRFSSGARGAEARAFVQGGHRTIPASGGSNLCIQLEPSHGSYTNEQVDVTSLTLASEGTGSVSEIHSVAVKKTVVGDTDRNGIAEIGTFFSRSDLAALFDQIQGRTTTTARLTGSLTDGRMFCAGVELNIVGSPTAPHASFAPNPLNPQSKLTFTTARAGPAKARIFDIQGRLVRTLLDVPHLAPGTHEYSFDGRTGRGSQLSSGVYFYRVESAEETIEGQLVILK